jgi:hypothetical protein
MCLAFYEEPEFQVICVLPNYLSHMPHPGPNRACWIRELRQSKCHLKVKVEPRQAKNSCLLLPSSDNVDRVDLLSDDRENSNCSPNLNEDLSGDQLLDIATINIFNAIF